jgi:uncharacterized protein YeaO (DUF488 family)
MTNVVHIKRIYEPGADADGLRVLVDRLWPRGVAKAAAAVDLWMKDVAPSTDLRRWFGHRPDRWDAFIQRYGIELGANPAWDELRRLASTSDVTRRAGRAVAFRSPFGLTRKGRTIWRRKGLLRG